MAIRGTLSTILAGRGAKAWKQARRARSVGGVVGEAQAQKALFASCLALEHDDECGERDPVDRGAPADRKPRSEEDHRDVEGMPDARVGSAGDEPGIRARLGENAE